MVAASDDPRRDLDLTPQQIMNLMRLQLKEQAFGCRMLWDCVTCYQCQEHCPQNVKVADVLYELRNEACRRGLLSPRPSRRIRKSKPGQRQITPWRQPPTSISRAARSPFSAPIRYGYPGRAERIRYPPGQYRTELLWLPVRHQNLAASVLAAARNLAIADREGLPLLTPCQCCFGNLKQAAYWLGENAELRGFVNDQLEAEGLRWHPHIPVRHLLSVLADDIGIDAIRTRVAVP